MSTDTGNPSSSVPTETSNTSSSSEAADALASVSTETGNASSLCEAADALAGLVLFLADRICSASVSKPNATSVRLFVAIRAWRSSS